MPDSWTRPRRANCLRWATLGRGVGAPVAVLTAVCGAAAILYAHRLGVGSLWLDEGISFWSAQVDWSNPVQALDSGVAGGLRLRVRH